MATFESTVIGMCGIIRSRWSAFPNEVQYARRMAREVGADYHERLLTQDDLIGFLPRMIRLQDEPIGDPVCVPVYYVSKLARDHGVIVLPARGGVGRAVLGLPPVEAQTAAATL